MQTQTLALILNKLIKVVEKCFFGWGTELFDDLNFMSVPVPYI